MHSCLILPPCKDAAPAATILEKKQGFLEALLSSKESHLFPAFNDSCEGTEKRNNGFTIQIDF